ncbi:MAG: hypothetical protein IPF73_19570, partial [Betaproteobacteria bacterium]|nr:hypothetical protein [Betaproteobacteria bacterium]
MIIGVKGRYAFGADRRWFAPYYLDVRTGDSDLTWQAMGGLGYRFSWGDIRGRVALPRRHEVRRQHQDINFNGRRSRSISAGKQRPVNVANSRPPHIGRRPIAAENEYVQSAMRLHGAATLAAMAFAAVLGGNPASRHRPAG